MYSLCRYKVRISLFDQTWIHLTQGCFVIGLFGWLILKSGQFFFNYITAKYLWKMSMSLHLKKNTLESLSRNDALLKVCFKLAQLFWIRKVLKVITVFSLFGHYSLLEKGVAFHSNKLEFIPYKQGCIAKWSCSSRENDFYKLKCTDYISQSSTFVNGCGFFIFLNFLH